MNDIIDYIKEPRFRRLIEQLRNAQTEQEADEIIRQHNDISMSPEEKERYSDLVINGIENYLKAADKDMEALRAASIRKKMGELDKAVSFAYIARNYFGKSQSWLLQRLNGSIVNGKEARFNRTELLQLQDAIHDLGKKLSSLVLI